MSSVEVEFKKKPFFFHCVGILCQLPGLDVASHWDSQAGTSCGAALCYFMDMKNDTRQVEK